jgi:nitrogen fixation protein NifU and related proteins
MNTSNLRDLYQQVILEHYKKPKHRGKLDPADRYQKGHNPSCGDTIELTVNLAPDGRHIADVKFEGEGCAIAMASVDLMAGALPGKTIDEALDLIAVFQSMMKGEAEFPQEHRRLNAMQGVSQFPVRIKCANLGWHTLKAALQMNGEAKIADFISNEGES